MERLSESLSREIYDLQKVHRGLTEIAIKTDGTFLSGTLSFTADYGELEPIDTWFAIALRIPKSYPESLPTARETSDVIEEHEHVERDGTLCLCVPVKALIIFHNEPTLLGFVNRLVIPFLYGYCYWQKYGIYPFGEQRHGSAGVVQFYMEEFNLRHEEQVMEIIRFLNKGYDGRIPCPCGSKRFVKKCHGGKLRELHHRHTPQTLQYESKLVLQHFQGRGRQPTVSYS